MRTWLGATFGALIALALAALGFRAWRQTRIADTLAIRTPDGIDETGFVRVGGLDPNQPGGRISRCHRGAGEALRQPARRRPQGDGGDAGRVPAGAADRSEAIRARRLIRAALCPDLR